MLVSLFIGYVEKKMLEDYRGNKPQLYKRYIDDLFGAFSGTRQDLEDFIEFFPLTILLSNTLLRSASLRFLFWTSISP